MKKRAESIYPKRSWSDIDKDFLRLHYNTMQMPEIMERLCRTDMAIHAMAVRLEITGDRYNVNNYQTGSSYKKAGRKSTPQKKVIKERLKAVITAIPATKKKQKRRRWCDEKLETKPFTYEGKKPLRIDNKTVIYISKTAPQREIENILKRYKKLP